MHPIGSTHAGFWRRFIATMIDALLILIIALPILTIVYGWSYFDDTTGLIAGPVDFLVSWVLPGIASIWFLLRFRATPGKLVVEAYVVDAKTGESMTFRQAVLRYFASWISLLPLGMGFLWIAIDPKKQGWHDKIAGTVVFHKPTA